MATIQTVSSTVSTNADLIALAATGVPEGFWLRAETQSGGRGRMGRTWESPPGNLYASTLVRLQPHDPTAATLALVTAVALAEVIGGFLGPIRPMIKWPNDILIEGAKVSGILLERSGDAVVIGMGVNLHSHPFDLGRPATCLASHGTAAPDPGYFLEEVATAFARWLGRWRGEGIHVVRSVWTEYAHPAGAALSLTFPDGTSLKGLFDGLDSDGALRLRLADGAVRVIHAADVFLI
jgi:BirA family transcriptional regulator, biotin operon repressor / biotin---[acetyl-CoA-carboxylase] ligase